MDSYGQYCHDKLHQAGYFDISAVAHRLTYGTNYSEIGPSGVQNWYYGSTGDAANFPALTNYQSQLGVHGSAFNDITRDITPSVQHTDRSAERSGCVLEDFFRRMMAESSSGRNFTSSESYPHSPYPTVPDVPPLGAAIDRRSAVDFGRYGTGTGAAATCASLGSGGGDWSDQISRAAVREARANYRGAVPLSQLRFFNVEDHLATTMTMTTDGGMNRDRMPQFANRVTTATTERNTTSSLARTTSRIRAKPTPKFACDHCERRFVGHSDYVRHLVTHSGVKAFVCPLCDVRFGLKHNMERHLRRIHGRGRVTNRVRESCAYVSRAPGSVLPSH